MIEIVFSDSACGSLKMAQHCGNGDYIGGCTGVIIGKQDGSQPTPEEISAAQKAAEEQERLDWENAVPMGGNSEDVFGFNLMLSIGDISADHFIERRQQVIEALWSIYPDNPPEDFDLTAELRKEIVAFRNRLTKNDEVRIWYSNQPDEMCGLYWFMWELEQLAEKPKAVYIVKLPDHEYRENNAVVSNTAWGEISPGDWHLYSAYSELTTDAFCRHCALRWKTLQSENAPLRAVLNGQLHSVSESIYDDFIYREINNQKNEFQEAMLIGTVLGKYQLGIGDAWVANRIEKMIECGRLSIVGKPAEGMSIYHRKLSKAR